MILQALKEYYERKAADPDSGIAPPGWEKKELPFLIVISPDGEKVVNIEDTRSFVGKKLVAKSFLVPQGVKRSSGIAANFLWDNVEYATGEICKGEMLRIQEQHNAFIKLLQNSAEHSETICIVLKLLNQNNLSEQLNSFEIWQEAKKECAFISFKIQGHQDPVFRADDVIRIVQQKKVSNQKQIRCLISGESDTMQLLHPAIKGVQNTNTTGGNIVSFNMKSVESYGKSQGANAPAGERAVFAYTTALNHLLGKDSTQKLQIGDATTIFWADKPCELENTALLFFSDAPKDDPDRHTEQIRALFRSMDNGSLVTTNASTRFYVLGLSPNAARISIRFWYYGTVPEMAERFRQYFDDLSICHSENQQDHLSLWRLLCSTAQQGESKNISPNLVGAIMRAVLEGLPFPDTLLNAVLQRIKADSENDKLYFYPRAKLIKAYLNRKYRVSNPKNERSISMSLDLENNNIGYRLGRLFATLEKIQTEANPGINATIRERYYAAASSIPVTVFANLMRLKNHHLAKLDPGRGHFFERLLGEILGEIKSVPAHLDMNDQGCFAVGYYHQNQAFYTKTNKNENN